MPLRKTYRHKLKAYRRPILNGLCTMVALSLFMAASYAFSFSSNSPGNPGVGDVGLVRSWEVQEEVGETLGLGFSDEANALVLISASGTGDYDSRLSLYRPWGRWLATEILSSYYGEVVNGTVDNHDNRLLLRRRGEPVLAIGIDDKGELAVDNPSETDIPALNVNYPTDLGADWDGTLYALDRGSKVFVFAPTQGMYSQPAVIKLQSEPVDGSCCIAIHPVTGHIHVLDTSTLVLNEYTDAGDLVGYRDLSGIGLVNPTAIAFAPSADRTDDPSIIDLYVADNRIGLASSQDSVVTMDTGRTTTIAELALGDILTAATTDKGATTTFTAESTLAQPMAAAASATTFVSSLVNLTYTSQFNPPSPDPAGACYNPSNNTVVVADSEVDEMGIFQGVNIYETDLNGSLLSTWGTLRFSDEPTGIAYNPGNGHVYISDDDALRVNEVNWGQDRLFGTSDDIVTYISSSAFGSIDTEGITYDPATGDLLVIDGANREVYRVGAGPNGVFDGTDDVVTHFDTEVWGVFDPEGVEVNTDTGNIYLVGAPVTKIQEVTPDGSTLVRTIDISAANAVKPAGLAFGPSSLDPNIKVIRIVDRNIDNNEDPGENDGLLYEMSLPQITTGNTAPVVDAGSDQAIIFPIDFVNLYGSATDDGLPNPPGAVLTHWSRVSGPGTVTFDDAEAETTSATFSRMGEYQLRLTANDGELVSSDDVTVTFTGAGGEISKEWQVLTSKDDVEESQSGDVNFSSSDLELAYDHGPQYRGYALCRCGYSTGCEHCERLPPVPDG